MLLMGQKMTVSDISNNLKISFKATSNHLAMLKNLDVLESLGKDGHVFYFINPKMPEDFYDTIHSL